MVSNPDPNPARPTEVCGVGATLRIVSGKWKPLILWHLRNSPKRFGELRTLMVEVSDKVLSQQLRELDEDGLVDRAVSDDRPPKVTYTTSPEGRTMDPVLDAMSAWGQARIQRQGEAHTADDSDKG